MKYLKYLVLGTLFGIILTKSEVVSWFRIQEMFRFQSFHMYGVIGSAILVGLVSIQLIKRNRLQSIDGEEIKIADNNITTASGLAASFSASAGPLPGPVRARCSRS